MKFLCVSPAYWPAFQFGGPISSMHGMNMMLGKKGIDVSVYTTNVGLDGKVPINQEVDVDGVKVTYFKFTKFFEFMGATGWQFSGPLTEALRGNLKTFDLIYLRAVWNYPTAAAAYYAKKYRKPYIISTTGKLYPDVIKKKLWKKWIYYQLIAKEVLCNASAIQYVTEYEMHKCHSHLRLKNRAIVVPNGTNVSEFSNLPDKDILRNRFPWLKGKKVILFMGRIHRIKGLDILIKAYSMITKNRADVHLLIVGPDEGGYSKKVKRWINEYGLECYDYGSSHKGRGVTYVREPKITFTGMLNGKEKLEVLAGSDIFVLPSYSEGFSNAVLEAMVCSLPVVISEHCHFPDVADTNTGIIVDCDSVLYAKAIVTLLDNTELCIKMGKNGQQLVKKKYTWNKVTDKIIGEYEHIIRSMSFRN